MTVRRRPEVRRLLAGLALVLLGSDAALAASEPAATVHPDLWPAAAPGRLIRPEVEHLVDGLLAQMSLEDKIGQMIQADIDSIRPDELKTWRLGSILAGGNAAPGHDLTAPPQAWLDMVDGYDRAALEATPTGHRAIPILFGIDAVHGHARIAGATIFPHNVGLGAAHDPALVERIGRATAEEVAATGIDWAFAPTVAVARDVRWGRSYESWSEDPALVAAYAAAMVTGLQGRLGTPDFMAPGHTISSVKHFLGDGGTLDGRDQGNTPVPEAVLSRVHAAGYPPAIAAGVLTVMASYNSWQGVKMHADHGLLTDVLKGRFGFDGFVIGDWNAQEEIPGCTKSDCPAAALAGLDMYMAPDSWKALYGNLLGQVRSGVVPPARIDDAVRRILRVKALAGLFDRPAPKARPGVGNFAILGSAEHRALARQAVRESLVLLKNDRATLPLDPHARILVVGEAADDIGRQCGGWTLDWQSIYNENSDFPAGTSIFAGIRAAVGAAGGTATLSRDGHYETRPDAAIIVFGEGPYAEYQGDRETVEFAHGAEPELELMRALRRQHIPVIAVFLSGRPLWVDPELNAADAFVAAWLPGTEGGGVADLLFRRADGKPAYDFAGRLGFSWPATGMPVTFDAADTPHGALFPRGFGLSYAGRAASLARLDENPHVPPGRGAEGTLFQAGHVTAPWSIFVSDAAGDVRLTMPSQPSPAGAVSVSLDADGFAARWSGTGKGAVRIGGRGIDLQEAAAAGKALVVRYKVDHPPEATVRLGFACGVVCVGGVDITDTLKAAEPGTWRSLAFGLSCLTGRGVGLAKVDGPLAIETAGAFGLQIAEARIDRDPAATLCPARP